MERKRFLKHIPNKQTLIRAGIAATLTAGAVISRAQKSQEYNTNLIYNSSEHVFQLDENLIREDALLRGQHESEIQGPDIPTYAQKIEGEVRVIQEEIKKEINTHKEVVAKELQVEREAQITTPPDTEGVETTGDGAIKPLVSSNPNTSSVTRSMHISGYYCQYDSGYYGDGGGFCGVMADGQPPHLGAAACGPSYSFGTEFEIEGYGTVICEDRGGGISNNSIDVFVPFSSQLSAIPQGYVNVTQVK